MSQALMLIDFQRDFGAPDGAMAAGCADLQTIPAAIANAVTLTDAARAAGVPVIFVRLLTRPDDEGGRALPRGRTERRLYRSAATTRRKGGFKTRFSAFTRNTLADDLRRQGIDSLVLAGLTTECCVAATAWAAFEEGFTVLIATDACAAYEPALHDNTLRVLGLSGARLATASDIGTRWKYNN